MINHFLLKPTIAIFSMMLCFSVSSQWQLADTTIQSARDVAFPHPNAAYLTTDMGDLYKSTDGGVTWTNYYSFGVFSSLRNVEFINKDTGYVAANYGIQRTFDGGQSWSTVGGSGFYQPSNFSIRNDILAFSHRGSNNDTIYVKSSLDFGDNFSTVLEGYSGPFCNIFSVCFVDALNGYIINPCLANKIIRTTNGGTSFDTIQVSNISIGYPGEFEFKNIENGYIFGLGAQFPAKTADSGLSFSQIDPDGTGLLTIYDIEFVGANKLYATSSNGKIFQSQSNGQLWTELVTPVSENVTSIAFADEVHGIAISGEQIIYTTTGHTLNMQNSTEEGRIEIYPNPSTSFIFIDQSLESTKSINLFDLTGQLVRKYDSYSTKLSVESLIQGTYILQIELKDRTLRKKVIIQ